MTLFEIIAAYEDSEPLAISRSATLTRRGHAAQALYRFIRVLRELDAGDRAVIVAMLQSELDDQPA